MKGYKRFMLAGALALAPSAPALAVTQFTVYPSLAGNFSMTQLCVNVWTPNGYVAFRTGTIPDVMFQSWVSQLMLAKANGSALTVLVSGAPDSYCGGELPIVGLY